MWCPSAADFLLHRVNYSRLTGWLLRLQARTPTILKTLHLVKNYFKLFLEPHALYLYHPLLPYFIVRLQMSDHLPRRPQLPKEQELLAPIGEVGEAQLSEPTSRVVVLRAKF